MSYKIWYSYMEKSSHFLIAKKDGFATISFSASDSFSIRHPGQSFLVDCVSLVDLQRFRDLRKTTQGAWIFSIHGVNTHVLDLQEKLIRVSPFHF